MVTFWIHEYPRELPTNVKYMCTCEDTTKDGTYHGHAFIYFKNPVTMKAVKKLFGKNCHCEKPVRNSAAIGYVLDSTKRKHDFQEFGTKPLDNGIHSMEAVLECDSVQQVMETMPDTYVKFRKGIIELIENKRAKNRYVKPIEVIWLHGPTGCGKTRFAFERGAVNVIYENGFFSDWGDARVICLEEMRGQIPYRVLLMLTDSYHNYYQVNIKGGTKLIDLDCVIITSPKKPEACYPNQLLSEDSIDQLLRRITMIMDGEQIRTWNELRYTT